MQMNSPRDSHQDLGDALCKDCFFWAFEEEVHQTISGGRLFSPGDSVAIGASGGKDSTVLAYILKLLNERYSYGLKLFLLSVDEGITGYRDDSLETVKRNQHQYELPLTIVSYEELYGWSMDAIVKQVGLKNNCTFCGVFRRQALDRGAVKLGARKIVTGHNADDIAETVIMNVLRGDIARLRRCVAITTGTEGYLPRCKPFKYTYEKEIVMYAYFKKLDYFSTECIYSPNAYRGFARTYIKELEKIRPRAIIDIIHSGESLSVKKDVRMPKQILCTRCQYISSNDVCKACLMLEGLNKGRPRLGIGKVHKERRKLEEEEVAQQARQAQERGGDYGHVTGSCDGNERSAGHVTGSCDGNERTAGHVTGSCDGNERTAGHVTGSCDGGGRCGGQVTGSCDGNERTAGHVTGSCDGNERTAGHVTGSCDGGGRCGGQGCL